LLFIPRNRKNIIVYIFYFFRIVTVDRNTTCLSASGRDLGLPDDWSTVLSWLTYNQEPQIEVPDSPPPAKAFVKKFPAIPTLKEYGNSATASYWENFPSKPIPLKPET
jgi:hypothetical protein